MSCTTILKVFYDSYSQILERIHNRKQEGRFAKCLMAVIIAIWKGMSQEAAAEDTLGAEEEEDMKGFPKRCWKPDFYSKIVFKIFFSIEKYFEKSEKFFECLCRSQNFPRFQKNRT